MRSLVENPTCRCAPFVNIMMVITDMWGGWGWGGWGNNFGCGAHIVNIMMIITHVWGGWVFKSRWFGMVARAVGYRSNPGWRSCSARAGPKPKDWGTSAREVFRHLSVRGASHMRPLETGQQSVLLTDGAKCYPKLAKASRMKHFAVNHARGEFARCVSVVLSCPFKRAPLTRSAAR